MAEQEKLQQEELALKTLEEVSGGSLVGEKAKQFYNDAKEFAKKHPYGVGAAAITLLTIGGGEIYKGGRLFRDMKDWANAKKNEFKFDRIPRNFDNSGVGMTDKGNFEELGGHSKPSGESKPSGFASPGGFGEAPF